MATVGIIFEATETTIVRDGTEISAAPGTEVMAGDVIRTAPGGETIVHLADESRLQLGNDAELRVDELVFDPATADGNMALSLLDGTATVLSGLIAKTDPDAMSIHTPFATIGIRGTLAGFSLGADGLQIVNFPEADGFVGEIVVTNNAGVVVLNSALELTSVLDQNVVPAPVRSVSAAEADTWFGGLVSVDVGDDGVPRSNEIEPELYQYDEFSTEAGEPVTEGPGDTFIPVTTTFGEAAEEPGIELFGTGRAEVLDGEAALFERDTTEDMREPSFETYEAEAEEPIVLAPEPEEPAGETPPPEPPPEEPGDHDRGHGNEDDGLDPDNPGKADIQIQGTAEDETFILGEDQVIHARGGHDTVQVGANVDIEDALKDVEELILEPGNVLKFSPDMVQSMTDQDNALIIRGGTVDLNPDEWSNIEDVGPGYTVASTDDVTLHIYDDEFEV